MEKAKKEKTKEQVWEVESRERRKRKGISWNIKKEEWVKYLKRVLGGVTGRMIREMRGDRKEDVEKEITRGEVKEMAVKKLKEKKAAGAWGWIARGGMEVRWREVGEVCVGDLQ